MMREKTEKDMLRTIKDLCVRRLPSYYTQLLPVRDIQILTPVRKGLLGSMNLNKELQEALNPPREQLKKRSSESGSFGSMIR